MSWTDRVRTGSRGSSGKVGADGVSAGGDFAAGVARGAGSDFTGACGVACAEPDGLPTAATAGTRFTM
ncbi:MAG: hypothetical protein DME17_21465 [Candidatus Rokuibacteriota bacterium]|nr:MAG: hypothetical protein DME17_21465 [Candidatus Rokubacteria bacterium]